MASSPSVDKTEIGKIEDDYKFFTQPSDLEDSIVISTKGFDEVIGSCIPDISVPPLDNNQKQEFDENAYAHYVEHETDEGSPVPESTPSTQTNETDVLKADEKLRKMKRSKNIRADAAPRLSMSRLRRIKSFVSIYLDSCGLTWARFHVDRSTEWPTISVLDGNFHKTGYERIELWQMIGELESLVQNIPKCDTYIIENIPVPFFRPNVGVKQVKDMLYMNQCVSIIVSQLASRNHEKCYANDPNVIFLKRDVMGKFFNLFIGYETVSTCNTVKSLIYDKRSVENDSFDSMENRDITFEQHIVDKFEKTTTLRREYLGKALLIGITFFRLNLIAIQPNRHAVSKDEDTDDLTK